MSVPGVHRLKMWVRGKVRVSPNVLNRSRLQTIKSAVPWLPRCNQTQPSSVSDGRRCHCQVLLQSGSVSSRVEADMIASKQPLLSSDTQLQPGTSIDRKSTVMDCLSKTADRRRSTVRCGSNHQGWLLTENSADRSEKKR